MGRKRARKRSSGDNEESTKGGRGKGGERKGDREGGKGLGA